MFTNFNCTLEITIVIALFSLGWFLIGVLSGSRLKGGHPTRKRGQGRRRRRGPAVEMYVGNLSYDIGERDLHRAFGEFGDQLAIGSNLGQAVTQLADLQM